METLADFGVASYFGVQTFTAGIYKAWLVMDNRVAAAQLATSLLLLVALMLKLEQSAQSRLRFASTSGGTHGNEAQSLRLHGVHAALAWALCSMPVLLGFGVPVLLLLTALAQAGDTGLPWLRFVDWTWNSLRLGAMTAVLAVGLALAAALDPDGQWGLRLKWPNDLCWLSAGSVRKLGGILIETQMGTANPETPARRWCVVGVGLNLRTPQISTPGLAPVGWSEVSGEPAPHGPDILQTCIAALVPALRAFELHGFVPLAERFAQRDALLGQTVTLSDGRVGTALGVDAQGALQVQTAQGLQAVHSAEVSVRPSATQGMAHV